ncbi:hypothetical protein [uncultured Roseobacter sp.]|uniref:hypothetical protein n=1 Tax=uncultured Roseobacter sp. TaxID=114847 RepID=UPI0026236F1A|nr:hypothetical protein [uncultured Roseobacter sp.]
MSEQKKHSQNKRPVKSHRDGVLETAIWRHETENGPVFNTERTRSYQDKEGKWRKTHSIPERDLLKAAKLDERAYESIQLMRQKEREKYIQRQKQEAQPTPGHEHSRTP